ncbi:hypothetical protein AX774_g146 [Zancudomyces culisetae]|uniref:Uncharacterized protein n=1 Tax=Zancudomyces culisetae TaxID=1213189 RepID=A0A1R1PZ79_ZANCU|nr:hypothetical protein AX774_g146 [Zancudomyces culisetae]|eukprot:OMH86255.1 hypothetical protein AX774_g146 [Zancudomyces culisetae]
MNNRNNSNECYELSQRHHIDLPRILELMMIKTIAESIDAINNKINKVNANTNTNDIINTCINVDENNNSEIIMNGFGFGESNDNGNFVKNTVTLTSNLNVIKVINLIKKCLISTTNSDNIGHSNTITITNTNTNTNSNSSSNAENTSSSGDSGTMKVSQMISRQLVRIDDDHDDMDYERY